LASPPLARTTGDAASTALEMTTAASPATSSPAPSGVALQRSPSSSGASATGSATWPAMTIGAIRAAPRRCSAALSAASVATPPAAASSPQPADGSRSGSVRAAWAAASAAIVSAAIAEASRAPTPGRRRTNPCVVTSPRSTTTIVNAIAFVLSPSSGSASAIALTPAMIATTAASSRGPTRSCSTTTLKPSRTSSPLASTGWTSVSGAWRSASTCSAKPATPRTMPSIQRGRDASRRSAPSPGRAMAGTARTSSACRTYESSKHSAAASAISRPVSTTGLRTRR